MQLARPGATARSIREIVFGVEDGAVQNMILMAGMIGADVSTVVLLLAGSVNALAGVVAMSMGTYLSSEAEHDVMAAAGSDVSRSPARDAAVMAAAYAFGASVPILPFAVVGLPRPAAVVLALTLTLATLFGLGMIKGIAAGAGRTRSGARMMILASVAGLVGYMVGMAAQGVFDIDL